MKNYAGRNENCVTDLIMKKKTRSPVATEDSSNIAYTVSDMKLISVKI